MALRKSWRGKNTWRPHISLKKPRWTTKKPHLKQKSTKTWNDFTLMSSVGCLILNKVVVENWMQPGDQELSKEPILCFLLHRLSTETLPAPKVPCQNVLQTTLSFCQRASTAPSQQRFEQEAMWTMLGVQQHVSWLAELLSAELALQLFGTQITSCIPFNPNWLLIFHKTCRHLLISETSTLC